MARIAACIMTYNEAARLPACLDALDWVDEVIVIDDESEDDTVALAEARGAKVIRRKRDRVDAQRNAAADAAAAEWVLAIDADELVTPDLAAEIRAAVARPDAPDVFRIPFQQKLFGRIPQHGGWTEPLTRLSRRAVRWQGPEHAQLVVEGEARELRHPILHDSHDSIAAFLDKMNRYTETEARERVAEGRRFRPYGLLLTPVRDFLRRYLILGGWRDGVLGLVLAGLMACYVFVERAKHWERLDKQAQAGGAEAP